MVAPGISRMLARQRLDLEQRDPIPSEDDVLDVARAWSMDPRELEQKTDSPGVGLIVRLM
ncbi:hypothetical protein AAW51_5219 [Caldimonas brevitalea]|uniref:Uncharacterized protein n=1 Tax=Caldimonas brevitalea TaxID=413882 RepID=A0A0G3BZE9_9BURK|nr:hypothetical protein AAW51_5219 [Caldimonas brevitalea]